jgi:hypothetical protein
MLLTQHQANQPIEKVESQQNNYFFIFFILGPEQSGLFLFALTRSKKGFTILVNKNTTFFYLDFVF